MYLFQKKLGYNNISLYLCNRKTTITMSTTISKAIETLNNCGLKPSMQRVSILEYLQTHYTHPAVEDVYKALGKKIPTLSKTTVYNTLRLLADHKAIQMLTMDEHRVCYDGDTSPHVHFICRHCGRIFDVIDAQAPVINRQNSCIDGNEIDEVQLFYKGVCANCLVKKSRAQGPKDK